ncbi:MAG: Asp23/Gls24 family envelope stress response protein [Bacilli bacterium]|nr:Asp23/Gls24 family envelope stress response protein [Bacilli bacterium]
MNTAIYLPINNYSKLGEMGISRQAVLSITDYSVRRAGANLAKKQNSFQVVNPAKVSLSKNGVAVISVDVTAPKDQPIADICSRIQKEISDTMTLMLDTLPIEVKIRVVNVI